MVLVSKGKHKVCSGDLSRLVFVPLIEKIVKFLFLDRCKLTDVPHLHVSVSKAIFLKVLFQKNNKFILFFYVS